MLGNDNLAPSPGDLRLTHAWHPGQAAVLHVQSSWQIQVPESCSGLSINIDKDNAKDVYK